LSSEQVEFLSYVITTDRTEIALNKIEARKEWQVPKSLSDIQSFNNFANFYLRYIKDLSSIGQPFAKSTQKENQERRWTPEMEKSVEEMKHRFTTAPILTHVGPTKPYILETDGSHFALGAILSQNDDVGRRHPIAFHSSTFKPPEINYEVHVKEFLAIVESIKVWHRYLEGVLCTMIVCSDKINLKYSTTMMILNWRQAHWVQTLAAYDCKLI
jgi:hypothetical protein